jgi:hypothetical protein
MNYKILVFITLISSAVAITDVSAQLINTSLTITVRDELGNTVSGAEVKLFETEADYLKEVNVVYSGITDSKGLLKLKKVKAISYYVIVRKEDKDNAGGGERIGALDEGKFNKATVIIQ